MSTALYRATYRENNSQMKKKSIRIIAGIVFFVIISLELHTFEDKGLSGTAAWQWFSFIVGPTVAGLSIFISRIVKGKSKFAYIALVYVIPGLLLLDLLLCTADLIFHFV